MSPRWIALVVAVPLSAAATAGALEVEHALAERGGSPAAIRVAVGLLLFVLLSLMMRIAGARAATSERPLRGVALAGVILGAWLLLIEWTLPGYAGLSHGIGSPQLRGLADTLFQLPWVLALAGAIPYLVRAAVVSTPQAPMGAGSVFAALALGAAVAFAFSGDAASTWGLASLGRTSGLVVLAITLLLLAVDLPVEHGADPPPGAQLGVTEDGQNPSPAAFALGLMLGTALVAWSALVRPLAGGPLAARAIVGVVLMGGLGVGMLVGGRLSRRIARPDLRMLLGLALTGYLVLASLVLFSGAPTAVLSTGAEGGSRFGALRTAALIAFAPAAIAAGITLLLGVRVRCDWTGAASSSAGLLLAWTVAGFVVGAGAGRLVLLPRVAPALIMLTGAGLAIAAAATLRLRAHHAPRAVFALLTILPLLALLWPGLSKRWTQAAPSAVAAHAATQRTPDGLRFGSKEDVTLYAELFTGRERRVDVSGAALPSWGDVNGRFVWLAKPDGRLRIDQAGRSFGTFSTGADAAASRVEVALGLIPALLHKRPTRALVLGPGTGLAVEALVGARVGKVDVVAPSTLPLDLARAYRKEGMPVFGDPRITVHGGGARGFLPLGDEPLEAASAYDVVVAGPPLQTSLFTAEGVRSMKAALRPNGLVALHLPFAGLDADALRRVLATVRAEFPAVWLFRFRADLVAVAGEALELGRSRWKTVLMPPAPAATLARRAGLGTPGRVLGHLTLDGPGVERILPVDGPTLSDDAQWLAHRMEANRMGGPDPRRELAGVIDVGFPPDLESLVPDARERDAWMAQIVEGWLQEDAFVAGVWDKEIPYGITPTGWRARARAALAQGAPEQAVRFLDLAIRNGGKPKDALVVARIEALAEGVMLNKIPGAEARAAVLEYGRSYPTNGRVLAAVGAARQRFGDLTGAENAFEAALRQKKPPPPKGTALSLARVLLAGAQPDTARVKQLMESDPALYEDADALDLYLGLLDPADHGKRAADIELAIKTLRRDEANELLDDVRAHIARRAFEAAGEDAVRATELQGDRASAWELRGLVELGRSLGADGGPLRQALQRSALGAFLRAEEVSLSPARTRERTERMARWFGVTLPPKGEDTSR